MKVQNNDCIMTISLREYLFVTIPAVVATAVTAVYIWLTVDVGVRNGLVHTTQPPYNQWIGIGVFVIAIAAVYVFQQYKVQNNE